MTKPIFERIFDKLSRIVDFDALKNNEYLKYKSIRLMDLNVDFLRGDNKEFRISMAHDYEQNGDLMCDPDMEIRVYPETKMAEAMTYQDGFGYKEVYVETESRTLVHLKNKKELNEFLNKWLTNLINQDFKAM